ncbi:unnamed protein product [Protopolystoma xenopodis]|uniref:Uncharacterized protein n=1 Tax=Protopolystoma xenopodis TaxID=117903 RepID=A0A3S4ZRE7_9PLAT|nr:unnamed protein product [Protopolystoma xenopodis]
MSVLWEKVYYHSYGRAPIVSGSLASKSQCHTVFICQFTTLNTQSARDLTIPPSLRDQIWPRLTREASSDVLATLHRKFNK